MYVYRHVIHTKMYTKYGTENINCGSQCGRTAGNSECSLKVGMYTFTSRKRQHKGVVQIKSGCEGEETELLAEDIRLKEVCLFGQKISEHRAGGKEEKRKQEGVRGSTGSREMVRNSMLSRWNC